MMQQTLVVASNAIQLQQCALYRPHLCAIVQAHHICPQSWFRAAGVPVDTPMIDLCPSCHMNIHAAIDGILAGRDVQKIPLRCRKIAEQGLALAREHGLPTSRTL